MNDPVCVPVGADSSVGLIVLMAVPRSGEKIIDLSVTHVVDANMAVANSVGSLVTLALVGPAGGSLAGS